MTILIFNAGSNLFFPIINNPFLPKFPMSINFLEIVKVEMFLHMKGKKIGFFQKILPDNLKSINRSINQVTILDKQMI